MKLITSRKFDSTHCGAGVITDDQYIYWGTNTGINEFLYKFADFNLTFVDQIPLPLGNYYYFINY